MRANGPAQRTVIHRDGGCLGAYAADACWSAQISTAQRALSMQLETVVPPKTPAAAECSRVPRTSRRAPKLTRSRTTAGSPRSTWQRDGTPGAARIQWLARRRRSRRVKEARVYHRARASSGAPETDGE